MGPCRRCSSVREEALAKARAVRCGGGHAVGGVGPANFAEWLRAGARGFGIGSALYKPGDSADSVSARAAEMVAALAAAS